MPEIIISKVSKSYPGIQEVMALSDISLTVRNGEFVCILGPSGCGKSTLLEIIAGLQDPTGGEILLDGKPISGPGPDLGVVFQDASLYPWRTILENIAFGLEIRGVPKKERREIAEACLKLVKLEGFGNKYPHQLSGGMRQRAGLARTLANGPKVLLMDEPFGAVDHLTRLQLQEDLLEIWERERKTVVFITHDVHEAAFLGDRVALLTSRPGRVQKIFNISLPRPRHRTDRQLTVVSEMIYESIYDVQQGENLEYAL